MKRPIRGMQGQIAAEERLLKAGGSPLSSMSSENRRRVTTDSPAQLSLPLSGFLGLVSLLLLAVDAGTLGQALHINSSRFQATAIKPWWESLGENLWGNSSNRYNELIAKMEVET